MATSFSLSSTFTEGLKPPLPPTCKERIIFVKNDVYILQHALFFYFLTRVKSSSRVRVFQQLERKD